MDSDAKLEPFLLLAKGQKGKGLIEVIHKAIAEPGLFVFGELLDLPGMQQLKDSDPTSHALLELFAYGTWHDYKGGAHKVPSLSADQELKLKQLTLATMAQECKVLNYEDLMQRLEFANVRELEDFIIKDCMYNNALKGKLDQRRGCLKVVEVAGRDIDPKRIGALVTGIEHWMTNGAEVMANIHEQIKRIQEQSEAKAKRQEQLKAAMEEATQLLQAEGKAHRDDDGMALDDEPSVLLSGEDRTTGSRLKRRR